MYERNPCKMRFQQLVYRTTPHSLVEWLDGELEKRGIDCVYTHCILSILQEDSDDTEPDECIDVRNNQQKVYHKYGGPESLYSATKSKHQKWKTYSKQILLTSCISCCDTGISDLERKNRNAAINCLKSVSDDNTIEDLIDEVCLKLKNIRNMNEPEKKDSVKGLNIVDKETAFYIPPSSPTDQIEKYFAAFPPLNKKVEEKIDSCQVAHLNAWYNNCIRKNKNIVQDILKNSNLNSFQNSENSKNKQDIPYGSLKSIENIYQPENNNSKTLNRFKMSYASKGEENNLKFSDENNSKFSDENGHSHPSAKKSLEKIDSNSSLSTIISSCTNEDLNIQICSENKYSRIPVPKSTSEKLKKHAINKVNTEMHKTETDAKRKSAFLNSTTCRLSSNYKKIKNTALTDFTSNRFSVLMEEEALKLISNCGESTERLIKCEIPDSNENIVASEILSNPCKKFKSCENVARFKEESTCSCEEGKQFDIIVGNINSEMEKLYEVISVKKTSFPKLKCRQSHFRKRDNNRILINDPSQIKVTAAEEQEENKEKNGFENTHFEDISNFASSKKMSARTETLKHFKNVRKQKKSKSSKIKMRIALSAVDNKINLDTLKSHSEDVKIKNICTNETAPASKMTDALKDDCVQNDNEGVNAPEMCLYMVGSFKQEDRNYKEELSTVHFMNNVVDIKDDTCPVIEINCAESDTIIFCDKRNIEPVSLESDNELIDQNTSMCSSGIGDDISEMYFPLPLQSEEFSHQNFVLPLANINLIIIGNNAHYKFNPRRALHFFSPHEIFNIITVGDMNEVNNFLRKFSVQSDFDLNTFHNLDKESESYNINDLTLMNKETKSIKFHCIDSKTDDSSHSAVKLSNSNLQFRIGNENSYFTDNFQSVNSEGPNPCQTSVHSDAQFSSNYTQKGNSNTAECFGNWNYNVFFDLCKGKTDSYSNNVSYCDHLNGMKPTFSFSESPSEGNTSNVLPSKQYFYEDKSKIDSSEPFYNFKNKIFICEALDEVVYDDVASSDHVLHKNCNFEEKHFSNKIDIQSLNKFLRYLKPDESVSFSKMFDNRASSAFKLVKKMQQPHIIHSSNRCEQNLLKKITNIDRIIQKINGRNRVTSFVNSQDISFSLPHYISEGILSHSSITTPTGSFNYSKDMGVSNFMQYDSLDKSSLSSEKSFKYFNSDWPKLHCTKSDDSLRSILESKISNLEYIWENSTKSVKVEEDSRVVPDNSNNDAIHRKFEEEQDELLKDLYFMSSLKDETNIYSDEHKQSVSNLMFESPYTLNINPENEPVGVSVEEYRENSVAMQNIMPAKKASKISDSNTNFDFSLSVPHADSVGVFSLDNCKNDDVDPQITCSDVNFPISIKNEAYQESGFIDVSAFRGPYGSYSENQTNCMEGGWSVESDSYPLESEAFHCQSSSLHELDTTGSENESFQYLQFDRQHFSSEDDEIGRLLPPRWPPSNMRKRLKHKYLPSRRPCAFYMEGNCNRSDCKFSHNLSNITCRFWQEGSCFKGSTCPFLHGYADGHKIVDQLHNLKKREPEHNYSLDSETDFPSLSATKSVKTPVAKSEPVDIVHVKEIKNSRQTNH